MFNKIFWVKYRPKFCGGLLCMSRTKKTIKTWTSEIYNYQKKDSRQTRTQLKINQSNEDRMRPPRAQRRLRRLRAECQ